MNYSKTPRRVYVELRLERWANDALGQADSTRELACVTPRDSELDLPLEDDQMILFLLPRGCRVLP